jgi:DNA-binding NarL/FixJ family response regulator
VTTVSARAARQFSKILCSFYASRSVESLDQAAARAVNTLFAAKSAAERQAWTDLLCAPANPVTARSSRPPIHLPFLIELLLIHVIRCRSRLTRRAFGPSRSPLASRARSMGLTAREGQVLERITLGETDAKIGRSLGISAKTVSKHVEHILLKLGVESRTAAAVQVRLP